MLKEPRAAVGMLHTLIFVVLALVDEGELQRAIRRIVRGKRGYRKVVAGHELYIAYLYPCRAYYGIAQAVISAQYQLWGSESMVRNSVPATSSLAPPCEV